MTSKPSNSLPSTKSLTIAVVVLVIINSFIMTAVTSISLQSLWRLSEWQAEKRNTQLVTMGGDEFLICRSTFSSTGLNLAAWWAHQQISLAQVPNYDQLTLEFKASTGSRLDVFFNPEFSLSLGSEPIFHQGWVFQDYQLVQEGWAQLEQEQNVLEISQDRGVNLNGKKTGHLPGDVSFDRLSLRGGLRDLYLKNLTLQKNGQTVYQTDFQVPFLEWSVFWKFFALISLLSLVIFLIAKKRMAQVFLFQIPLSMILMLYLCWDYFLWSQYPLCSITHNINQDSLTSWQSKFEKRRYQLFKDIAPTHFAPENRTELGTRNYPARQYYSGPIWCNPICQFVEDYVLDLLIKEHPQKFFIVFLGSSQTNGSGATTFAKTFYAQAMQKINRSDIVLLNLAKSSYRSDTLFEHYKELLKRLTPALLIHNWGHNDYQETLPLGLKQFLTLKQHRHIFLKEATSVEYYLDDKIKDRHKDIDKIAQEFQIPVIDWHGLLHQHFIKLPLEMWWDWMHFNDLGHQHAAVVFESILREELRSMGKEHGPLSIPEDNHKFENTIK